MQCFTGFHTKNINKRLQFYFKNNKKCRLFAANCICYPSSKSIFALGSCVLFYILKILKRFSYKLLNFWSVSYKEKLICLKKKKICFKQSVCLKQIDFFLEVYIMAKFAHKRNRKLIFHMRILRVNNVWGMSKYKQNLRQIDRHQTSCKYTFTNILFTLSSLQMALNLIFIYCNIRIGPKTTQARNISR